MSSLEWDKIRQWKGYPISIPFIVVNEFCERFSFYGLRTVLILYFTCFLNWSDEIATEINHVFVACCYLFPLVGGVISDSYLGKFRTILILSLVFCSGGVVLAITAIPGVMGSGRQDFSQVDCPDGFTYFRFDKNNTQLCYSGVESVCPSGWTLTDGSCLPDEAQYWGAILGLMLVAIGTGGIKPCVSSFGGDQFSPAQGAQLATFFSIFYFSINTGSFLSTIITPLLRKSGCPSCTEDPDDDGGSLHGLTPCSFFFAFAVPAILMFVATLIFYLGRRTVGYRQVPPAGSNLLVKVGRVVGTGLFASKTAQMEAVDAFEREEANRSSGKKPHFLDTAIPIYGRQLVEDIKVCLSVCFIFLPLPFFWALFDQTSSTWTLQAKGMSGSMGSFVIEPDQMHAFNSVLILILLPTFENLVYPAWAKVRGAKPKPLFRMGCGIFLCSLSFGLAGIVQTVINNSCILWSPRNPNVCEASSTHMLWQVPQYFVITAGEIMFSITGLEFAYSQAPQSMKAVLTAAWYISTAAGNFLVVAFTAVCHALGMTPANQLFFYSGLCFISLLAFVGVSWSYTYVSVDKVDAEEEKARLLSDSQSH